MRQFQKMHSFESFNATGPRNQMNQASSFLDLSVTYGSTHETEEDLVDFSTGKKRKFSIL